MIKSINVPAEIRKYWWEKSENLINVPGTTISDSRVYKIIEILSKISHQNVKKDFLK